MHDDSTGVAGAIMFLIAFAVAVCLYFLPSIVALTRHSHNLGSVVVLNLFLGWTLVGWVVSLALAVKRLPQPQVIVVQQPLVYQSPPPPPPPR